MRSAQNLALFSVGKLELLVAARNVALNVLLALLSNSSLRGVGALPFSTVVIALGAEVAPRA